MNDFSQSGEQAMILDWADRRGRRGYFLDVGAVDGEAASNTRALALRLWDGVCVEPAAWAFDKLACLYADRDDIAAVQAVVTVDSGPLVPFHYSHDLLSTTQDENAETWRELATFVPTIVAAVTVEQLLAACPGPYDFASIDTEGTSVELWEELRRRDAFAVGALVVIEAEDGGERWQIQRACLDGWARVGVTPNNVLLERL